MERIVLNVNPLNESNLSCVVEGEKGKRAFPLDIAVSNIETLAVRRKGSQANNVGSVRLVPLSAIHFTPAIFGLSHEDVERFTEELLRESEEKGEPLPEYVAVVRTPSSFIHFFAKVEGVRTPFHKATGDEGDVEYKEKEQLKAYETPDTYMVPAFKFLGRAYAEAYLKEAERNMVRSMADSKILSAVVSFPKKAEEADIFSVAPRSAGTQLMNHEEFLTALRNIDPEELGSEDNPPESLRLYTGEREVVVSAENMPGDDEELRAKRWQAFLKAVGLWVERIKILDEYRKELERGDGSPFDLIRALLEDKNISPSLRGAFARYPEIGVVDFQAGSGRHLKALNEELNAGAKLLGVEYRDIPPDQRIGEEDNRVQYGIDCLVFFPQWNDLVPKHLKSVGSMVYYLNPPYMNDRTISMRSVTAIPEGALTLGLFSTKDEKLLSSNFEGYLVKIPVSLTGYEDPESPRYFLALIGVKTESGKGNVYYLDLEGQEDRFRSFEEVMDFLIKERPSVWEKIVSTARERLADLNHPNLKVPRAETVGNLISDVVRKLKTVDVEKWRERFEDPEEAVKTLSRILSLDANAVRGERVFPDLRVVGTPRLLSIDEVLGNLHLLSFYRDAYPEWYEMAKRVASMIGRPFPDIGDTDEKEVVVSEHLGILKYKYLPKVIPVTDEIREVLFDIGIKPYILSLRDDEYIPESMVEEYAKMKKLLEKGSRLIVKTRMEATSVGGDVSFGYTPVLAVEDEFGRHLGTISVPLATFYEELEKRGIVDPTNKYEVAEPDGELISRLVDRYIEHVRATAREHLGIEEEKEERLREALKESKSFKDFRRKALDLLSEDEDFRLKAVEVFKEQVLSITDVREELIASVSSLLSSLGEKKLLAPLGEVIEEVAKWYKEYPFIFLSTRMPEDVELYREEKLGSEEEISAFNELPWVKEGQGSEEWVRSLIEQVLIKTENLVAPDVVEDIKDTIFQTLSEHSSLEEGVRQGTERFILQYLYTYVLEPLLAKAKEGDDKSAELLIKGMRNLFVNILGVMPHQYDEAINLLAKKVKTGEKGHLLGWEMRSGKTLAMSLIGYFNALHSGKDVYMFPKTANMLDIIYQIATFTPQVAFNLRAYKSGDVELGLVEDRIDDVITTDVYPNIFAVTHTNRLLVGAGKTAEELLQTYAKDMEELIGLYERRARESGEGFYEEEIEKRRSEGKPYRDVLDLEGFSPAVRLALYDYLTYLEKRGILKDLKDANNRRALEGLLKALNNLSKKITSVQEASHDFFTFHVVPKYHLYAVQFRIPRGEKSLYAGGKTPVQVSVNKDLSFSFDEDMLSFDDFKSLLNKQLLKNWRPFESFGLAGAEFLTTLLERGIKDYLNNGGELSHNDLAWDIIDITGASAYGREDDITSADMEELVEEGIISPVRRRLIELLNESEGNSNLFEFIDRLITDEGEAGEEEGEVSLFAKFLASGLGVATETMGEIKPSGAQSQPHPLTTSYLSFSFNEELDEMLSSLDMTLSDEDKRKIEDAVNEALRTSTVIREIATNVILRGDPTTLFERAYAQVATPEIIKRTVVTVFDPTNAIKHPKNMENTMGHLYGRVYLRATEGRLKYSEVKPISAELTLNLPPDLFGGKVPVPHIDMEEGKKGIIMRSLGRVEWKEGGNRGFVPYPLEGENLRLAMTVKGKGKPAVFFRVDVDDPKLPELVEVSTSNATNYFVHSRFFRDRQPIAIIDEADESTNPNAKGYLAFYYISHNSELAVASTGTPTSGDVKTPIALIGLVSALPLDTIENSVKRVVEDFAVFSIKEEKTVPYLIMSALLQLNRSASKDTFIPNLVSSLIEPVLDGKLKDEDVVRRFVELIDLANKAPDGSIIGPSIDYQLEKIKSGDIPHYKLVSDIMRIVFAFNKWLKREGKVIDDIVHPPEAFRDAFTDFLKERGVATISPGTYDPIGFVSMLSNASLLTRETLKQAIDPTIEETKDYKDLGRYLEMLKAQAQEKMEQAYGNGAYIEQYAVNSGKRSLWDITISRYRSKLVLSEVFSFYMNNLYQLVNAISGKPEPFLERYMEENAGEEKGATVPDVLDMDNEEHREILKNYIVSLAKSVAPSSELKEETLVKNAEECFEKFLNEWVKSVDGKYRKVKGVSLVFLEDGDPVVNIHLAVEGNKSIDEGYALNLRFPYFSEPGGIPSPNANLTVARTYMPAKAIADPTGKERGVTIPEMSKQEFKSLLEKSSKTKADSVLDILKEYIVRGFTWEELELEFDRDKVRVAQAVMDYFTRNFLERVRELWDKKQAWNEERKRNDSDKGMEEESFTCTVGNYEIVPYLPPVLFSERIMIEGVKPNGQITLTTSEKMNNLSLAEVVRGTARLDEEVEFSATSRFHRDEWDILKKENAPEDAFSIRYRLKFLVDEENEIIDMFTNRGLRERITELVREGKSFLVAPSRKKVMSFALLDVLSDLYFEQRRRKEAGQTLPTYHVLVRVTDREHMRLIDNIDREALEDLGIVVKVFHHHTELDMEAKKLKGIMNREKARGENRTKMVVVAPAKTISRGVDFSMLDEMVVLGTLDGNGRDFAQLLARLYNNSNKHHAEISMFGTPLRLRPKGDGEDVEDAGLAVNYSSLVQLKLLRKEEFIRAVMSGKIANILDRDAVHVRTDEEVKEEEMDRALDELAKVFKDEKSRNVPPDDRDRENFRNVSPSL